MFNFLSLLGWSLDGETEIIPREILIDSFDANRISSASAIFDIEKLNWMNGLYIRNMSDLELATRLTNYWEEFPPDDFDRKPNSNEMQAVASLLKERIKILSEASGLIAFVFKEEIQFELQELVQKRMDEESTKKILEEVSGTLSKMDSFSSSAIELELRSLADSMEMKVGALLGTVRVATSGQKVSPPLFESLEVLGRDRVLDLLRLAKSKIS